MELRFDVRKSEGQHLLRIWAHDDAGGFWYVARVVPLAEKQWVLAELDVGEIEVNERLDPGGTYAYAYPWLRGELKGARGNGAYIINDEDIEGADA